MTPQSRTPRCQQHRWAWLLGFLRNTSRNLSYMRKYFNTWISWNYEKRGVKKPRDTVTFMQRIYWPTHINEIFTNYSHIIHLSRREAGHSDLWTTDRPAVERPPGIKRDKCSELWKILLTKKVKIVKRVAEKKRENVKIKRFSFFIIIIIKFLFKLSSITKVPIKL